MSDAHAHNMFADDFESREQLMKRMQDETQVFRNPLVKEAFEKVDRKDFVKEDYKIEAYEDYPLPQGHGSTISQPTTVAFMLERLDPQMGDSVLDVGCGSGFTTALLAEMVGENGKVTGVDIVPELVEFANGNLSKYDYSWAEVQLTKKGVESHPEAPFERILVSASFDEFPQEYVDQLKVGGVLVAPVNDTLFKITKKKEGVIEKESYPGFAFVDFER